MSVNSIHNFRILKNKFDNMFQKVSVYRKGTACVNEMRDS